MRVRSAWILDVPPKSPAHVGVRTTNFMGARGNQPLTLVIPSPAPRPLHIAVVQGNLPAVHRLVNLFQHGGRELDIYNNLRQVSPGAWIRWKSGPRVRTPESWDGRSWGPWLLSLREDGLQVSGS